VFDDAGLATQHGQTATPPSMTASGLPRYSFLWIINLIYAYVTACHQENDNEVITDFGSFFNAL
jgi:hypothetical protein